MSLPTPYYTDPFATLYQGDCLEIMAQMEPDSIDAIVTDPPYLLSFMGKDWDKGGQDFHRRWAEQAYRVLKPGGHMLVAGIGRTHHRMMCGVEGAGFEVRDCIYHFFGSGFPKSHNLPVAFDKIAGMQARGIGFTVAGYTSSATVPGGTHGVHTPQTDAAKQWQGWGTALKPAAEVWVHFTKPLTAIPPGAKIIAETTLLLEALLWLLAPARFVELTSRSSLVGSSEADNPDSAQWIAAVLNILESPEKPEATATFSSLEAASIFWNIALSWSNILAALSINGSMSTISMETSLITGLKTLNSFLSMSIPAEVIQVVSLPSMSASNASIAGSDSSGSGISWRRTPKPFALSDAGWTFASVVLRTLANIADMSSLPIRMKDADSAPVVVMMDTEQHTDAPVQLPSGSAKAAEVWVLFRKPLSENNVAANVLRWGTGAINIDATRVGLDSHIVHGKEPGHFEPGSGEAFRDYREVAGRWPPNVVFTHHPDCQIVGEKRVKGSFIDSPSDHQFQSGYAGGLGNPRPPRGIGDPDGLETVPDWRCIEGCPVAELGRQSGELTSGKTTNKHTNDSVFGRRIMRAQEGSTGTAARFFPQFAWEEADFWPFKYVAKADRAERERGVGRRQFYRLRPDLTEEQRAYVLAELVKAGVAL